MYSGLVLTRFSGRLIGAHQHIDRIARRHLAELLPRSNRFPGIRAISHFEGVNGPDGIKRKSPSSNEPKHFLDPLDVDDPAFLGALSGHYRKLIKELKSGNTERAAFEAAWLAHVIVDGLTPAHHYPFEQKVTQLLGSDMNKRKSVREKLMFKGDTKRQTIRKTFKAYGPRGIYMAHGLFELGFGWIIKPLRLPDARPSKSEIKVLAELGPEKFFMRKAKEVAMMGMYDQYLKAGWSSKLVRDMRQQLAPLMVRTVTLMWHSAAKEAGIIK